MDVNIPIVNPNMPRGAPFPPPMGPPMGPGGFAPQGIPAGAMRPPFYHPGQFMNPAEISQKASQFAKGIYVSGFETALTAEMLEKHFKLKPIAGMKLPLTKYRDNKGFAFIYYESADDAAYVKDKLDHSVILTNKIRVTKTVNAENLSKMMFKLKTNGKSKEEIEEIKQRLFNEKALESEISKIINPIFKNTVEVNKIIIPKSKLDTKATLNYARGFFYISKIKDASTIVKSQIPPSSENRKDYEVVLSFIVDLINNNPELSKHIKAQIYEYSNKNRSNVLHIKNIPANHGEDPAKIAEELKTFIQDLRKQDKILGCFVAMFGDSGAWANVMFDSFEEVQGAYEFFKNNRVQFRGSSLYATMKNVKDLRTVVVSTVKKGVSNTEIRAFFNKLAERSPRVDANDESKGRKYDISSFNVIEQKTYFHTSSEKPAVGLLEGQEPEKQWIEENTVPRRVVLHFNNEIQEKDVRQLVVDIKMMEDWEKIFFEKDAKNTITANHQKGHIESGKYVRHSEPHKKKREDQPRDQRPKGPRADMRQNPRADGGQFSFNRGGPRPGGVPRTGGPGGQIRNGMVPIRQGQGQGTMPSRPLGQMGPIPGMGGMIDPKMGHVPKPMTGMQVPPMGGMQVPPMGSKPDSMPMMGGLPPMRSGLPPMGNTPMMGVMQTQMGTGVPPMMGGNLPPIGGPKMGGPSSIVTNSSSIPPAEKKQ